MTCDRLFLAGAFVIFLASSTSSTGLRTPRRWRGRGQGWASPSSNASWRPTEAGCG